jgi:hypothetical protein
MIEYPTIFAILTATQAGQTTYLQRHPIPVKIGMIWTVWQPTARVEFSVSNISFAALPHVEN